jgi:hypothetical protein
VVSVPLASKVLVLPPTIKANEDMIPAIRIIAGRCNMMYPGLSRNSQHAASNASEKASPCSGRAPCE